MTSTESDHLPGQVGVDIGGTTMTVGLFKPGEQHPSQLEKQSIDQFQSPEEWLGKWLDRESTLIDRDWIIGVPSPVQHGETMAETPNLPEGWQGQAIPESFRRAGVEFRLENDANLAALGEAHYGAGRDVDNLLLLTLGTGIGGGIVIDNHLFRGTTGAGAEVGHLTLEPGGRLCGCGGTGCFERYGSATGLEITYEQLSNRTRSARDIMETFGSDPLAREAVIQTGLYLGRGLADLVNLLEPGLVLFSGGLSHGLERLLPWIKQARDANLFAGRARDIPMRRVDRDEPALMGARALMKMNRPS